MAQSSELTRAFGWPGFARLLTLSYKYVLLIVSCLSVARFQLPILQAV